MFTKAENQAGIRASPTPEASALVRSYLDAMEARDLDKAKSYLSKNFQMTFPGGVIFKALEALIEWGSSRYRFVNKTYERFDETTDGNKFVVYCFGTLAGEHPDGNTFKKVRFIDRITVSGNKLIDQQV
jgi:hypothetical protein